MYFARVLVALWIKVERPMVQEVLGLGKKILSDGEFMELMKADFMGREALMVHEWFRLLYNHFMKDWV